MDDWKIHVEPSEKLQAPPFIRIFFLNRIIVSHIKATEDNNDSAS